MNTDSFTVFVAANSPQEAWICARIGQCFTTAKQAQDWLEEVGYPANTAVYRVTVKVVQA